MSGHKPTICGDCENSVGYCSWSSNLKPVRGWKAKPTIIRNNGVNFSGFCVIKCPYFVKSERQDSLDGFVPISHKKTSLRDPLKGIIYKRNRVSKKEILFVAQNCKRLTITQMSIILKRPSGLIKQIIDIINSEDAEFGGKYER